MQRSMALVLLSASALHLSCASSNPAVAPESCQALAVRDGETFAELVGRGPQVGEVCLRYHRATAEVSWAMTPRQAAPILTITRAALELREGDGLVGAWYGPCGGEPPLRGEVSPEATHYMVRFMTLRRPAEVQLRVGPNVSSVDLMFALETMSEFGHRVFLDPRPVAEIPACQLVQVIEPNADAQPQRISDPRLDAVVSPRLPLIQSCFRRTVRPLPCSSLVRRVDLGIDARGAVVDATVADHTLGTPDVDACVDAAIWDLVFPPTPDGRPQRGTLRFQNCEQNPGAAPTLELSDK